MADELPVMPRSATRPRRVGKVAGPTGGNVLVLYTRLHAPRAGSPTCHAPLAVLEGFDSLCCHNPAANCSIACNIQHKLLASGMPTRSRADCKRLAYTLTLCISHIILKAFGAEESGS